MDIVTIISTGISIAAFILSVIALWQSHFAKFKLVSTVGNLQIRIYPFGNKKTKRYIPCIDIPVSLTNEGARVGKILGLRVSMNLKDSSNPKILQPRWEVDNKKFEPISAQRFEWIDKAVLAEWMPFVVLPKQTVTKHLIFEADWNKSIIQDPVTFDLEIFTNNVKKWKKIATWKATLSHGMWSENDKSVSSFVFTEDNSVLSDY